MNPLSQLFRNFFYNPILARKLQLEHLIGNHIKIVPAILQETEEGYTKELSKLIKLFDTIDIDILNGSLYSNRKTYNWKESVELFRKIYSKNILNKFEFTKEVKNLQLDFMIEDFTEIIAYKFPDYVKQIILPLQSSWFKDKIKFDQLSKFIKDNSQIEFGVSIANTVKLPNNLDLLPKLGIKMIQILTVEAGKQGNIFLIEQYRKINLIKSNGLKIKLDGSMKTKVFEGMLDIDLELLKYVNEISVGSFFMPNEKTFNEVIEDMSKE